VAGVEEEMNGGAGRLHQGVDVGLALHGGAHVVVVDEPHPLGECSVGHRRHATAELGPRAGLEHRPLVQRS
jgi:hypothetical protein